MNVIIISGRLTKDVEVKQTQNGGAYARFTLAVEKYQKDKQKKVNYIDCVAFSHSANYLGKYCAKGTQVTVQGELDCTTKEKDDGSKVTYYNVIAYTVEASKVVEKPQEAPQNVDAIFEDSDAAALPFEL